MSIFSYSRFGFSGKAVAGLTGPTVQVFACGTDAALPQSVPFPRSASVTSVEFEIVITSGTPATVTMFLARDADGDRPLTDSMTKAILPGKSTPASKGGACFDVDFDVHYDASSTADIIYVVAALNVGAANAVVRVNWRA